VTSAHTRPADAPGNSRRGDRTTQYEIRVAGVVGDELAPYVENMTSVVLPVETVVRGEIADQSALHGMLDQVQALGLELIEVRALPRNAARSTVAARSRRA
jgi:hypothetical protein